MTEFGCILHKLSSAEVKDHLPVVFLEDWSSSLRHLVIVNRWPKAAKIYFSRHACTLQKYLSRKMVKFPISIIILIITVK